MPTFNYSSSVPAHSSEMFEQLPCKNTMADLSFRYPTRTWRLSVAATKNLLVQVDLCRALGNETYLSVSPTEENTAATASLQVRIAPDRVVRVGEQVWLSLALDKIHFFDSETNLAIWSQ